MEKTVRLPLFMFGLHEVRRETDSITQQFLKDNPIHDVCESERRVVSVDVNSTVGDVDSGFQPTLCAPELLALECDCEVNIKEGEKKNLVELAPGVWEVVHSQFSTERKNFEYNYGEPYFLNLSYEDRYLRVNN